MQSYPRFVFENFEIRVIRRLVKSLLLLHELFRTQLTRHENQEVVSRWLRHSRFVPVYELRLNRDLPNSNAKHWSHLHFRKNFLPLIF